jgi:hypothetical protein
VGKKTALFYFFGLIFLKNYINWNFIYHLRNGKTERVDAIVNEGDVVSRNIANNRL